MKTLPKILLAALFLAVSVAGTALAANEGPQYEGISSYSVTRLKIFEGSVWVRTPDSGEWEEFQNNSPVPERALVSVPEGSEGELQFHGGQFLLLTGGTDLDLQRLEDGITVFRLRSGEIRFDLPEEDFAPVRVMVPNDARVDLPVPGKYWLTAPENEDSRLVVRAGEATVTTDRGESAVRRGEEARIGRDVLVGPYAGGPSEEPRGETALSDEERQAGVPPAAATELREYGQWVYSSEYGYVWQPRVAPGWTPYYYGRWVWISPYGWTWISSEPWGWYPYHYGYWYTDLVFGWVWYPYRSFVSVSFVYGNYRYPHYHRRVYYYPATVRFVGYGSTVRWVPLRPGERVRRVRYTRADPRLTRWEKPLPPRTIYVRKEGPKGREWTDWKGVRTKRGEAMKPPARVPTERRSDRPGATRVTPERERVRERPSRPGPSEVAPERERIRERPSRTGPNGVAPERERIRERPTRPGSSGITPERERVQERPARPGPSEVAPERERTRERPTRPGSSGITPERERVQERPAQPPARRMERTERPGRESSRRPPSGWKAPVSRKGSGGSAPEPATARPNRAAGTYRPADRTEFS
ncbi:MAG TPA: DUF6600 domain-containing protein, partial [Candidatus Deferrimicrobiaceae bacterium]